MLADVEMKEIGIREGEKLHEVMITTDDSRTTYEYEKHHITYPYFDWWDFEKHFTFDGNLIEEGFEYHSGNNIKWLNIENLRNALKDLNMMTDIQNWKLKAAID